MIRYLTSLLLSATANKLKRDLFRKRNSAERIAEVGLRKKQASRANFSEAEDRMIVSLQAEHGNNFALIAKRVNEKFETNWSNITVRDRFLQLEKEEKEGGRKLRKVIFTGGEDEKILSFHGKYIKENGSTNGMWKAMAIAMPGKNEMDLRNRYNRHLSKTSSATARTSTALTLIDNQPNLSVKKVAATSTATTKVAVKKVAAKKKMAHYSDSEQSDGHSSSESEASDGYSSSESDAELLAPPQVIGGLSEYELLRAKKVARNKERLEMLGLGPTEAKKKVAKKRTSPPVNEPQRVLPERKRYAKTYNDDYTEDVY